jgi:soluble lytic murein transglycosylase
MTMLAYWAKTTPALSFSRAACGALALLLAAGACRAQALESLARAFHQKRTPANRAALVRFAAAHPKDQDGALALLALAVAEREHGQSADAVRHLSQVRGRLPKLADYAGYYRAAAQFDLGHFEAAVQELDAVWKGDPRSPLGGDAAMLAARAQKEIGKPADAVGALRANYSQLPQPAGDLLLASCYRASNDLASAVVYYQRVYYQYPATGEAEQAGSAVAGLKRTLGELFPPPTTQAMFQRADRWLRNGDRRRARAEYEAIAAQAAGGDRELARVRLAEIDYFRYENGPAYANLKALRVTSEEADAERLYYMLECARRLDREDQMQDAFERLARLHPQSPWRLKALVSAGNRYLVANRPDLYEPLYRACYESFPADPQAANCHWKVAWIQYAQRRPGAGDALRDHLLKFPGSENASAALYYLGRLAETDGRLEEAKAYYSDAVARYPNHYYFDLAEKRLAEPAVFQAAESASVRGFLNAVAWPERRYPASFEPTAATLERIERGRLLGSAGLADLRDRELRFGAGADGQPHILAMYLARAADSTYRALRIMKSLAPGYMSMPLENAPAEFWRLLFPLPYRAALEMYSKQRGLDPFLVAGLIRQESEFNPEAVSPAQAYGLTQLLPSTGRALLKVSPRRFRASILFRPEVNLRLGTTYLRGVYDKNAGKWEPTLAAYNAGGSRVENWLTWATYREPAEFIETIPFSETRNYVFAVLRNAQIYRKLYATVAPSVQPKKTASSRRAPASPATRKKTRR